jgi:hypothetical protein
MTFLYPAHEYAQFIRHGNHGKSSCGTTNQLSSSQYPPIKPTQQLNDCSWLPRHVWDYRLFEVQWDQMHHLLHDFKIPAVDHQLEEIEFSMDTLKQAFGDAPAMSPTVFVQWKSLKPMIDQCQPKDKLAFAQYRSQIEPLMVKLQVVFAD